MVLCIPRKKIHTDIIKFISIRKHCRMISVFKKIHSAVWYFLKHFRKHLFVVIIINTIHETIFFTACQKYICFDITERSMIEIRCFLFMSNNCRGIIDDDLLPVVTVHIFIKSSCRRIFQGVFSVRNKAFYKLFICFFSFKAVRYDLFNKLRDFKSDI